MVIALRLFVFKSVEEDMFFMSLITKPLYVLSAPCVYTHDLSISAWERGRICKC